MTKLLQQGIDAVRNLPNDRQDTAGEILLALADAAASSYRLDDEQVADLRLAVAQADRGEFATEEEIAVLWRKFGL